jgi:hypothetical protein
VCHNGGALDFHPQLGNWVFILSFSNHWINIVNHGEQGKKKTTHQAFENLLYKGIIWWVGQPIYTSWED